MRITSITDDLVGDIAESLISIAKISFYSAVLSFSCFRLFRRIMPGKQLYIMAKKPLSPDVYLILVLILNSAAQNYPTNNIIYRVGSKNEFDGAVLALIAFESTLSFISIRLLFYGVSKIISPLNKFRSLTLYKLYLMIFSNIFLIKVFHEYYIVDSMINRKSLGESINVTYNLLLVVFGVLPIISVTARNLRRSFKIIGLFWSLQLGLGVASVTLSAPLYLIEESEDISYIGLVGRAIDTRGGLYDSNTSCEFAQDGVHLKTIVTWYGNAKGILNLHKTAAFDEIERHLFAIGKKYKTILLTPGEATDVEIVMSPDNDPETIKDFPMAADLKAAFDKISKDKQQAFECTLVVFDDIESIKDYQSKTINISPKWVRDLAKKSKERLGASQK